MNDAIRRRATHVLYRFFNTKGDLLYIGITNNPESRFRGHRGDKPWWDNVADIKMERFGTRKELIAAEIKAIHDEKPRYNQVHSLVAAPEKMRPRRSRRPQQAFGNDASRFYTSQVAPPTDLPHVRRWRIPMPCVNCHAPFIYRLDDGDGECRGPAECDHCNASWTPDAFHQAFGLFRLSK